MDNLALSYMAGFFDGEGSISILKRTKKGYNVSHFVRVSVGQKDGATLDWMVDNFGGNVYYVKYDGSYQWAVTDVKAYTFLKAIIPFLRYKKPQAELAITFHEDRIFGHGKNRKRGLTPEEIATREKSFLKMKLLKKTFTKSTYCNSVRVQRLNESTSKGDVTV